MSKNPNEGKPTVYLKKYDEQCRKLCLLGYTNAELAEFLGVSLATINAWIANVPSFAKALYMGRDGGDAEVVHSMFKRANGYSHKAVKIMAVSQGANQGATVERHEYIEHYPPDVTAGVFLLTNRQRKSGRWRNKTDLEVTGKDGGPIQQVVAQITDPIEAARLYQEFIDGT